MKAKIAHRELDLLTEEPSAVNRKSSVSDRGSLRRMSVNPAVAAKLEKIEADKKKSGFQRLCEVFGRQFSRFDKTAADDQVLE